MTGTARRLPIRSTTAAILHFRARMFGDGGHADSFKIVFGDELTFPF